MTEVFDWGKPAPKYFPQYTIDSAYRPSEISVAARTILYDGVAQGLRQIDLLVQKEKGSELNIDTISQWIPLSKLEDILAMSETPGNFRFFKSTTLVTLCVRLMSVVKVAGKSSPFSFAYGYACFRILMLACGVNLLQRTGDFDKTIAEMHTRDDRIPLQIFSDNVAQAIQREIETARDLAYCDYILGWSQREGLPSQEPLMHISDASFLVNLLYEDRKCFLQCLLSTYSPGLSGVFFLLWRCWRKERLEQVSMGRDDKSLSQAATPVYELFARYGLAVTEDQLNAITPMHNDMSNTVSGFRPGYVDAEDSRTVVQGFIDRFHLDDGFMYQELDPSAIPPLLSFTESYLTSDAKDLFPTLLSKIIKHWWDLLFFKQYLNIRGMARLVAGMGYSLAFLTHIYDEMQPIPLSLALETVDNMIKEDLLGLIARIMIAVLESLPGGAVIGGLDRNEYLMAMSNLFFQTVCAALPKSAVKSKFANAFPDWIKFDLYFRWKSRVTSTKKDEEDYWMSCGDCLRHIIGSTQQISQMDFLADTRAPCEYPRCSDPMQMIGARFSCAKCLACYCSMRCQAADLKRCDGQTSHRLDCMSKEPPIPSD